MSVRPSVIDQRTWQRPYTPISGLEFLLRVEIGKALEEVLEATALKIERDACIVGVKQPDNVKAEIAL